MKKNLRNKLDLLWSKTIRERDGKCMHHIEGFNCNRLNAHHVVFKSQGDSLRWEVFNGISLGVHCHRWNDKSAHRDTKTFNKWFAKTYPDRWAYIQKRKKIKVQYKDFHYDEIKRCIEAQLPLEGIE